MQHLATAEAEPALAQDSRLRMRLAAFMMWVAGAVLKLILYVTSGPDCSAASGLKAAASDQPSPTRCSPQGNEACLSPISPSATCQASDRARNYSPGSASPPTISPPPADWSTAE